MPKPRERDPNDKIKGLAGKPPQKEARRQMTAKLRKALAHRNRDGAEVSAEAQATDQTEQAATVYPAENGFRLEFDQPQRAPTPGQSVVLYQGDVVLGGGIITRVEK